MNLNLLLASIFLCNIKRQTEINLNDLAEMTSIEGEKDEDDDEDRKAKNKK